MKFTLIFLATFLLIVLGYELFRMTRLIKISSELVGEAHGFERSLGVLSILVLGDSTAVGIGSSGEESVAGRLSTYLDTAVENHAESGARTDDVGGQLKQVQRARYDIILIQVGANDVIRFGSIPDARDSLDAILARARELSDHVVLLTAGKIGEAPFFPRPLGFLWTNRAAALREEFMAAAKTHDVAYVDLYSIPDPFASDPVRYYAPDGLHLTGDGYGFWYEQVIKTIIEKWPKLVAHER